jgi:hypothetical protein
MCRKVSGVGIYRKRKHLRRRRRKDGREKRKRRRRHKGISWINWNLKINT